MTPRPSHSRIGDGRAHMAVADAQTHDHERELAHPREPMSRDKLMDLARGREHESYDRSIDVQVSRLRKLLGEDPQQPRYIQTVWGFGYVFIPDGGPQKA